jgi:hypothetical protein
MGSRLLATHWSVTTGAFLGTNPTGEPITSPGGFGQATPVRERLSSTEK